MDNLIELIKVSSGYKEKSVLKEISFNIKRKEFVALIGPNGAGKTTLFKTLMGILTPDKGEVNWKGRDLMSLNLRERAKQIAVLPQIFQISFSYSVEEFVLLGMFPYMDRLGSISAKDLSSVKKIINMLGISDIKRRRLDQISGGELQKVFIAQTLAQGPDFMLLDEPTSHLDIGHQIEIMNILKRLNRDGLTIITVLHDLNLAAEYCNRLILLSRGEVIKDGSPWDVLRPEIIKEVYNAELFVKENPYSKKPFLVFNERKEE